MIRRRSGIAWQIALAALLVAGIAIAILVVGVLIVGAQSFADLMAEHGESTEASREMFVDSVGWVVVGTIIVAVAVAVAIASLLGARLAMPLREIGRAARQIAAGDYRARIPRTGPRRSSAWRTRSTRWRPPSTNRSGCGASSSPTPRMSFGPPHQPAGLPGSPSRWRDRARSRHVRVAPWKSPNGWFDCPDRSTRWRPATRASAPATIDLDLARLIRSAVDLARPGIVSGGLELSVDVPTDLPARGDPDQLAQVLSNLLQNAVRYTPAGGRIDVRAERRQGDVLVSVSNTGDGIPSEDLPHVFERFYRVEKSRDRAHGGAGIGLAIVRQLVEAAGGRVGAESRDGRTTFWFSLPA